MVNHYNLCSHSPPVRPAPPVSTDMHLTLYNISDILFQDKQPPLVRDKVNTVVSPLKGMMKTEQYIKDSDPQLSSANEEMSLLSVQQGRSQFRQSRPTPSRPIPPRPIPPHPIPRSRKIPSKHALMYFIEFCVGIIKEGRSVLLIW